MERDADGRLLVVADSSFLINFLAVDRMDILSRLPQFRFHVVNHVRAEIRYESQRGRLQAATEGGGVTEIEIMDPAEILLYDEFRKFLGDGESASLAVAVSRRWVIAADEKGRFRRELFTRPSTIKSSGGAASMSGISSSPEGSGAMLCSILMREWGPLRRTAASPGKATADSAAGRLDTRIQVHENDFWRAIDVKGCGGEYRPTGRRRQLRLTAETELDHRRRRSGMRHVQSALAIRTSELTQTTCVRVAVASNL